MKQKMVIMALSFFIGVGAAEQVGLGLESPFPKNTYTQALDAAMQVWSTVELVREAHADDRCFVCDTLIGRLTRLYDAIGQIKKERVKNMEDLCYLYDTVAAIQKEVGQLQTRSELGVAAGKWLEKINARLEKMFDFQ